MIGERIRYFDILKGIAIFWVVFIHVAEGINSRASSGFFSLCPSFLVIFAFISAWLFQAQITERQNILPMLKRRFIRLVVSAVIMCILLTLFRNYQLNYNLLKQVIFSDTKYGYWFTPMLFAFFLLHAVVYPAFRNQVILWKQIIFAAVICTLAWAILIPMPDSIQNLLGYARFCRYLPVYFMGIIAFNFKDYFYKTISNNYVYGAACISVAAYTYMHYTHSFSYEALIAARTLAFFSLVVLAVRCVKAWADYLPDGRSGIGSKCALVLEYMGKRSLAIYFMHFFFLFPLHIEQVLEPVNYAFVPLSFLLATIACAITAACLIIDYILSFSRPLSLIFTGGGFKRKNLE